jgi:hypothetical protein
MNILGIGKIGSAIAEKFKSYPQYSVFKISSDLKTEKNNFFLEEYSNPEQYDNNPINPNFNINDELDVILCGEELMCASTLRILENYKSCSIRIFYIKPSSKFLAETQKMTDKVVYNVLQEYTRSKKLESFFILEYDTLVKTIGKVPLTKVKDELYTYICSTIHMINFLDNNEPVMSNYQDTPVTYCINTIGIMDFKTSEENKFFLLDNVREKRYYYCINDKQLNTDGELFDTINNQIDSKIEENCNIMFGVYSSNYNENYCYVVYKSPYIQK